MQLNSKQIEAVEHERGPLLIVAGAGSGKTRTLTARLARLVERGVDPWRILAITFTNKAAKEMQDRVDRLMNGNSKTGFVGTFHSLGAKFLRAEGHAIGRNIGYTIFDADDSLSAVKAAMEAAGVPKARYAAPALHYAFGKMKSELLTPEEALDLVELEVWKAYEAFLARNNAFDFDDLIEKPVQIMRQNAGIRAKWQGKFDHILVDEYQDVNAAQYALVRLLAEGHRNIAVVGDDAQAIYGWRSADYRNFLNFEKDWAGAKVVFLDENYRSSGVIVAAASALIRHNKFQKPKNLWTSNQEGDKVYTVKCRDGDEEAEFIVDTLASAQASEKEGETSAILFRTNAQSRPIEQALISAGIAYNIFGGLKFYERKEIKDIVAAIRVAWNPFDEISRERISKALPAARARAMNALLPERGQQLSLVELIGFFLKEGMYLETLAKKFSNLEERRENIAELISFAGTFTDPHEFLERVSLLQSTDSASNKKGFGDTIMKANSGLTDLDAVRDAGEERNKPYSFGTVLSTAARNEEMRQIRKPSQEKKPVVLMTIHMAKGLEFDRVIVAGVNEGTLPHHRSYATLEELEEERRLMYVAMTRARKYLSITFTSIPSRFLYELPPELVSFTDLTGRFDELPDEDNENFV